MCVSRYVNSSITVPLSLSPSGHPHNKPKVPPGKEEKKRQRDGKKRGRFN